MFILYAVLVGLLVGLLAGGHPRGLASLSFRWAPVMLAGLLVQVVLFSDAVAAVAGDAGPPVYVASTLAVLVAVARNRAIPGIPIVLVGALSNLVAIVGNGGYMPASPAALAALGKVEPTLYSNSSVPAAPVLAPLTDIFALPGWIPFANIFSIGDVILGCGVAVTIIVAMRTPAVRPDTSPEGMARGVPVGHERAPTT